MEKLLWIISIVLFVPCAFLYDMFSGKGKERIEEAKKNMRKW
jgi:hypothetical protein